jgi:hypothetical protein
LLFDRLLLSEKGVDRFINEAEIGPGTYDDDAADFTDLVPEPLNNWRFYSRECEEALVVVTDRLIF